MAARTFPLLRPFAARAPRAGRTPGAHRARLPRPAPKLLAAVALVVVCLFGGWRLVRDSSLVAATDVNVSGVQGVQAGEIRDALTTAAADMTTLHVRVAALRTAVGRFPVVADVKATGHVPHRLDITVVQRTPVAVLRSAGSAIPVAADGTLLRGAGTDGLPTVAVTATPGGTHLTDALARAQVAILAAAPAALRDHVTKTFTAARGLELQLRDGPAVAFGAADRLAAKWAALVAVLADPASAGGTLIDLTVPERPAVAGLEPLPMEATGGAAPGQTAATTSGDAPGAATTTPNAAPATTSTTTTTTPAPASGVATTAQPPAAP
ncbi:FtsQ-type POTRA domain-containing protein [Paraconexibacter antarcticus]|uniref:FtsQ-type POTRA domain-containing protein n=1 Tax=Paraconexibacter antarcticus TaxID=2949664 RepID=A0ABY5DRG0_9ACTN|nr:FtsQ-type POTRA domain-containing protein [Paraconexibacter antarcticus]UTI63159.1 FtsQ-type POTRA domain-containing protein [Paraconexibacter antarcticus]